MITDQLRANLERLRDDLIRTLADPDSEAAELAHVHMLASTLIVLKLTEKGDVA